MQKQNFEHTLGIKVEKETNAKAIYYIKTQTGLSLSDIKTKIQDEDYIFESIVGDLQGLQKINQMKKKLQELGVEYHLYQDDEEESSEFFDNIEQRGIDTAKEIEEHF